jgi:putative RecB family exonuclease
VETELDSGLLLRGYIDRLDVAPTGQLRVVDYKTGAAPRQVAEARALFQMKFYALALLHLRGVVPTQLRLLYLADEESLTYEPEEAELRRFERTLDASWAAILTAGRTGDFRPSPSRMCDYCSHKPLCPAWDGTPPDYPGWPAHPEAASAEETPADRAD